MTSNEDPFQADVFGSSNLFKHKVAGDVRFSENNYTYIILYISSINQAKMIFTNKLGQKFYPPYTTIHFSSWIHKMQDMEGAAYVTYEDPLNGPYYKLKPFQSIVAGKSRRSQDLWSVNLHFVLPDRFVNLISSIEFEEVQRINSSGGMDNTPFIRLEEWRIVNNENKIELLIKEHLPTTSTDYKKYTF